jgi:hypothetical protein
MATAVIAGLQRASFHQPYRRSNGCRSASTFQRRPSFVLGVGDRTDDDEFVAADATGGIAAAQTRTQPESDERQA